MQNYKHITKAQTTNKQQWIRTQGNKSAALLFLLKGKSRGNKKPQRDRFRDYPNNLP